MCVSNTFADDSANRRKETLHILVVRALLGFIYQQKGSAKYVRPPCMNDGCHSAECAHPKHFGSVMGTHKDGDFKLNFREFIIYDNKYVYPEYLVTYNRV